MSKNLAFNYESFGIDKYKNVDEEESEEELDYQRGIRTRRQRKTFDHNKQSGSNWDVGIGLFPKARPALKEGNMCTDVSLTTTGNKCIGFRYGSRDVTPRDQKGDDMETEEDYRLKVDPKNPDLLYKRTRHRKTSAKIGDHVHQTQTGFGFQW